MNITQLKEAFPVLINLDVTPLIVGHRGVGKSEVVKQYAKDGGHYLFDLRLGQMSDSGDLLGLAEFMKDDKGQSTSTKFVMPTWMQNTIKFAEENPDKYAFLFFDEINRAPKDISQVLFQLLLDKKYHETQLPVNVISIAAMNPPTENYNVYDFADEAYFDRFLQIKLEPSIDEWLSYAKKKFPSSVYPEFIRENPSMLAATLNDFELSIKPSNRSSIFLMTLESVVAKVSPNLNDLVFLELAMGLVGAEVASSYFAFKKESTKIITGDQILNEYPSIKDKVNEYFKGDAVRGDLIEAINGRVIEILKEKTTLESSVESNLVNFCLDLPNDFFISFMRKLKFIESIYKCESQENLPVEERFGLFISGTDLAKKISNLVSVRE